MKGIIYCIKEVSTQKMIYIGSTVNLNHRIARHKCDCFTKNLNYLIYNYIRSKSNKENFYDVFKFEIILETQVENRKELRKIENDYISRYRENLFNSMDSYIEDKKEYDLSYHKEYYINNKQKWLYYYENNKDKILKNSAEYYLKNKDKIRKNTAEYYLKNKDKIRKNKAEYYKRKKNKENPEIL